mmetsp:Transcript_5362/g.17901  ORF Transcript_5362/g.17901 Transcript_5362/m.17901 type:complete len:200 (+) Transcript_5362:1031-1630(+)
MGAARRALSHSYDASSALPMSLEGHMSCSNVFSQEKPCPSTWRVRAYRESAHCPVESMAQAGRSSSSLVGTKYKNQVKKIEVLWFHYRARVSCRWLLRREASPRAWTPRRAHGVEHLVAGPVDPPLLEAVVGTAVKLHRVEAGAHDGALRAAVGVRIEYAEVIVVLRGGIRPNLRGVVPDAEDIDALQRAVAVVGGGHP